MKPWERYSTGGAIDTSRPIIENPDGSFSTERTITVEADGRHFLIPTIVDGKERSEDEAIRLWQQGGNREVGAFESAEEAERAAVARSAQIGQVRAGDRAPAAPWARYERQPRGASGAWSTPDQERRASIPGRILQGVRDPLDAGAQMLAHALPGGAVDAVNRATAAANEVPVLGPIMKALGMTPATPQALDESIAGNERDYQAARKATGSTGIDLARAAGNIAATAPLLAAAPQVATASLPARIAVGAGTGAAAGALQPVTENAEDFASEKGKQAATGAAFGAVAAPITGALARVVRPRTRPEVDLLVREGVSPSPGQIMGGVAARTEEKLRSLPIVGDAISGAHRRGIEELNRAAYARALAPIGGKLSKKTPVGREAVDEVARQLGAAYDNLLPRLQFRADPRFAQELVTVQQMATQLPPAQAQRFEQILRDQVIGKLTPHGNASGVTIKAIESDLGRLVRGYSRDQAIDNRLLGDALQEVQATIRRTLERVNPAHARELGRINQGYSIFARIRDAASRQGSADGVMTPAQLAAAVRAGDHSVGKGAYARGNATLQDLSDAGRGVLAQTVPNSGTADRMLLNAAAGGGAALLSPTVAMSAGAATLPYLAPLRRAVAIAMTQRPQAAGALAQRIREIVAPAAAVGAPALYEGARN